MSVTLEDIKKLRSKTGFGVMETREALEEAGGDMIKAEEILHQKGLDRAEKKGEREVKSGRVYAYTHQTGKLTAVVEVACETDSVARMEEFETLCKEVALQVASMKPKDVDELLAQDYIRDTGKKVTDLVKELSGKTGENIKVVRFARMELGGE